MMKMKQITKENETMSLKIFHKVFPRLPEEYNPYEECLNGNATEQKACYYLIYDDEQIVGITGNYMELCDPESGFLGWFGVVPEMRRFHYGSKILALHEEELKRMGYKYSRLYTEVKDNEATCAFYERNGYVKEEYDCNEDALIPKGVFYVYSKALGDGRFEPWDSKNLDLSKHVREMYTEEELAHPELIHEKAKNIAR